LFRQYLGYGYWKVALAAKRPDAIRPRHFAPTVFVAGLVVAGAISILRWPPALPLIVVLYFLILAAVGLLTAPGPLTSRLLFPLAVATMHVGYGLGSWQAILQRRWRR
jgi:heme A synthase